MTVGQLADQLERASPAARRATLDRMRVAAGLDTTAGAEAHARYVAANSAPTTPRDARGNVFQTCAADGCSTVPSDPATGLPIAVPDRTWWCPAHRDQAAPDDYLPPEEGQIDPRTMAYTPPPSETAPLRAEQERLREEDRRLNEARAAEVLVIREAAERYRREHPPPLPPGFIG